MPLSAPIPVSFELLIDYIFPVPDPTRLPDTHTHTHTHCEAKVEGSVTTINIINGEAEAPPYKLNHLISLRVPNGREHMGLTLSPSLPLPLSP